ncbi:heterokaryon incompatibility protein-domain-containing protein [Tricladium varicosporioides]|nr:heterokaryon incompatibility protein-domain-containing protein [Hymenoscyphus varicosporioides]
MRKFLGKKKKDSEDSGSSPSGSGSSQPPQGGSSGAPGEVLSVKPAYLNLAEFTFPTRALSMFSNSRDEEIILDRCRWCSDGFTHTFMNWTTNIIAGIPQTDDYRAISYVWGQTVQLPMRCSHCGHSFHIPMHSAYRFRRLMMMTANSGDSVWLDALSIDQTSPEDKARVIAVMGDIYSRAKTVAVLFPEADGEGFKIMYDLTQAANAINANKLEFSQPGQDGHPRPRLAELSKVCTEFYEMLGRFDQNLHKYLYWRRAWTFQEWALARNISITWEGGMPVNLEPVKTVILRAAITTSIYAFSQKEYAIIKMGLSGASVPGLFETVRRLFPDELAFHPLGTVDEKEISIDVMMPSMRFGSALGLRASRGPDMSRLANPLPIDQMFSLRPNLQESEEDRFRNRLSMALSTFGISKREAGFEADLISCWASMCNIKYEYKVHDSYVVALQKVLRSLRTDHKIKVYNFLVNTSGASGEVDANFQDYACLHEQCNAAVVRGRFYGIPMFTGRADTGVHLRLAIARPTILPQLKGSGTELRKIKDASILFVVPLKNHDEVLFHMARCVSGTADGMVFTDVLRNISEILKGTSPEQLERSSLVVVSIPLDSPDASSMSKAIGMLTWAIIPCGLDAGSCFVAREGINGTLCLATSGKAGLEVVAYVTLTDHQSGTLLISVAAHELNCGCGADHSIGNIELTLKSPIRGGVVNSALLDDRLIRGNICFEGGTYVAY